MKCLQARSLSLMTMEEIRETAEAGVSIQLHTHRHRFPVDEHAVRREIEDNRAVLESVPGVSAHHFCYPSGDWSEEQWPWLEQARVRQRGDVRPRVERRGHSAIWSKAIPRRGLHTSNRVRGRDLRIHRDSTKTLQKATRRTTMCGIAGILGPDISVDQVRRMVDAQRHRGPDDFGIEMLPAGHARSSNWGWGTPGSRSWISARPGISPCAIRDQVDGLFIMGRFITIWKSEESSEVSIDPRATRRPSWRPIGRWGRGASSDSGGCSHSQSGIRPSRSCSSAVTGWGSSPCTTRRSVPRFLFASELRAILETGLVARKLDRDGVGWVPGLRYGSRAFDNHQRDPAAPRRLLDAGFTRRGYPGDSAVLVASLFVPRVCVRGRATVCARVWQPTSGRSSMRRSNAACSAMFPSASSSRAESTQVRSSRHSAT